MTPIALVLLLQLATGTASDYALPQVFQLKGKVIVGLDEPVMTVVTMTSTTGVTFSAQTFANGTFRINNVGFGTYQVSVADSRFNLFEDQFLLREPADSARELTIRLVRRGGEGAAPPELDPALYAIDAETARTVPPKAMDEYNKGVSALRNPDRNNPADAHFKRAIAGAPKFYEAHLQLGLEQHRLKKDSDAIKSLESATAIRPEEPRPLSLLGELYWSAEKFQNVIDALSKLDRLDKMGPRDHYHLGSAYYRLNDLNQAEKYLLESINTGDDKDPAPFLQLHNVFMKNRQAPRGLAVLEDYLKLFPNDAYYAAMSERVKQMRAALKLPPPQ